MNATQERIDGPTPAGGAYAVAFYRTSAGDPAVKENAQQVEVIEYSKDGKDIAHTFAEIKPARTFAVRNFRK